MQTFCQGSFVHTAAYIDPESHPGPPYARMRGEELKTSPLAHSQSDSQMDTLGVSPFSTAQAK